MAQAETDRVQKGLNNWWIFNLLGLLLIALGIWAFRHPEATFLTLVTLFSMMIILSGIGRAIFSIVNKSSLESWGWQLASGFLDILIGLLLITYPGITFIILCIILGLWISFRGTYMISFALELRKYNLLEWKYVIGGGVFVLICGLLILFNPALGLLTAVFWIGMSLILAGIVNILISMGLRKIKRQLKNT